MTRGRVKACNQLDPLRFGSLDADFYSLLAEILMTRFQFDQAGSLFGADPHRSRAAGERERILTDNFAGSGDVQ